jgi:hypothetical protein
METRYLGMRRRRTSLLQATASRSVSWVSLKSTSYLSPSKIFSDGREWLDTINSLPPNLRFVEPSDMAKELVPKLRAQGAEMIVSLNHMVLLPSVILLRQREPNDVRLAKTVPEGLIDIVLGGHDHYVLFIPPVNLIEVQPSNGQRSSRSAIGIRFQRTHIHRSDSTSGFTKVDFYL